MGVWSAGRDTGQEAVVVVCAEDVEIKIDQGMLGKKQPPNLSSLKQQFICHWHCKSIKDRLEAFSCSGIEADRAVIIENIASCSSGGKKRALEVLPHSLISLPRRGDWSWEEQMDTGDGFRIQR